MDHRRTHVIRRDPRRDYPLLVRGEGVYRYDAGGRRYLDGSGGSAAVLRHVHVLDAALIRHR